MASWTIYYNKKLFIHYFLVPGRQGTFLVRGGCSHPRPYRAMAYDFKNWSTDSWDKTGDNIYWHHTTSLSPLSQYCLPIRHNLISEKTEGTFVHNYEFLEQKWLRPLKKWKKLNLIGILLTGSQLEFFTGRNFRSWFWKVLPVLYFYNFNRRRALFPTYNRFFTKPSFKVFEDTSLQLWYMLILH